MNEPLKILWIIFCFMILPLILNVYLGVDGGVTFVLVILATIVPLYLFSRIGHRQWLPRSVYIPLGKLKKRITPKRLRFSKGTIALTLIGGLLLVMGIAMMYDSLYVSIRFSQTTGVVTSYVSTGEGSGYYTVGFVDHFTGNQITGTTNVGVSSPIGVLGQLYVGKRVDVLYDPQNPTKIRIASIELWLWPITFTLAGIAPIIIGFREARARALKVDVSSYPVASM